MKKPNQNDGRRSAIALSYRQNTPAPRVVAKGYGQTAERIIEHARQAGVFVHDSPELVSLLMQVDLDQHIPPELYRAVAEVLAFVYYLEKQAQGQSTEPPGWLPLQGKPFFTGSLIVTGQVVPFCLMLGQLNSGQDELC